MCDYSLEAEISRRARDEDKLILKRGKHNSKGFVAADCPDCYVCLQPGDEIDLQGYGLVKFTQQKSWMTAYHDGFIDKNNDFILFQHLAEGTTAEVKRALPSTLTEALTARNEILDETLARTRVVAPAEA